VAVNDPTFLQSVSAALEWARAKASPYLTWLPDELEPHAVDAIAFLVLLVAVVGIWSAGADLWRRAIWGPRAVWRLITGYEPPEIEIEAIQRTEAKVDDLHDLIAAQVARAEEGGVSLPEDAIDRAVEAAREVLASNDPSKAEAREALREGNVRAAEDALEEAFGREAKDASLIDDQAAQLKAKAARTAREKAALAATRSVAEALRWYRQAAELEPEDCWTHIELARLHRVGGNLVAAHDAAQTALGAAKTDRDQSLALDELGDVLRLQGDLGKALESYQASHGIFERLAEADASNAGLQRNLSVSHERIGDLHEMRGETFAAVGEYEASLVIAQTLADRFPDHPQFQTDLVITKRRLNELRGKLDRQS